MQTSTLTLPELPPNSDNRWEPSIRVILLGVLLSAVGAFGYRSWNADPFVPVAQQLSQAQMDELFTLVPPTGKEDDFDKIPWRTSIWEARQEAAKEGKPILLWEMDGHPLGCG